MTGNSGSSNSLYLNPPIFGCHRNMRANTGTRVMAQTAISLLTLVGLILVLAATGCGDEGSGDGYWFLELLDGQPIIEESVIRLRISGDQIEGFDGCNHFQGPIHVGAAEDESPVAGPDGVFSLPSYAVSEVGCEESRSSQADEFWSALHQGERYLVAGDRLEISDGEGATRLVFVRE